MCDSAALGIQFELVGMTYDEYDELIGLLAECGYEDAGSTTREYRVGSHWYLYCNSIGTYCIGGIREGLDSFGVNHSQSIADGIGFLGLMWTLGPDTKLNDVGGF